MSEYLSNEEVARELLRLEEAREARRKTRNKVWLWLAAVLVVALAVGVPVYRHQQAQARERCEVNRMFDNMVTGAVDPPC